jgi:hypothetical protein
VPQEEIMNQYLKCTEYVGDYYGIQPTAGGEFIVRQRDGRELARWPTIEQARKDAQERQAADVRAREERVQLWADDREFGAQHRDLTVAQLRWQDWRNWFFAEMAHEARRLGHEQRASDPILKGAAAELYHQHLAPLDAQIKAARRAHDVYRLTELLRQSEQMITEMDQFFPTSAHPDDARPTPGPGDLITLTEAAAISGVPVKTLSSRIERGQLRSYPDETEPNPRRRARVLRSEIVALAR